MLTAGKNIENFLPKIMKNLRFSSNKCTSYSHRIKILYICQLFLIKFLGLDTLRSYKADKRSSIFPAYEIGENSSVQGLHFRTLFPNWHIPQLAPPLTGNFLSYEEFESPEKEESWPNFLIENCLPKNLSLVRTQ